MRYVALGDSFAAGIGSGARGTVVRNAGGYPLAVAKKLGLDLSYQASSGAEALDVLTWQVGGISDETEVVTLSLGGNDAGFSPVLIACAQPAWMADGVAALEAARGGLRTTVPDRLRPVYREIRTRAPRAGVVVSGYPHLFAGIDCSPLTFFSDEEMALVNSVTDDLLTLLAELTAEIDGVFVDLRGQFEGHAVCTDEPWLHSLSWPVHESFHPTMAGHRAYVDPVAAAIAELLDLPAGPPRRVRVERGPHALGAAPIFVAPDLLSNESLAGARAHGIDPAEVVELARRLPRPPRRRQDASGVSRQATGRPAAPVGVPARTRAAEAAARLQELDRQVRDKG